MGSGQDSPFIVFGAPDIGAAEIEARQVGADQPDTGQVERLGRRRQLLTAVAAGAQLLDRREPIVARARAAPIGANRRGGSGRRRFHGPIVGASHGDL